VLEYDGGTALTVAFGPSAAVEQFKAMFLSVIAINDHLLLRIHSGPESKV